MALAVGSPLRGRAKPGLAPDQRRAELDRDMGKLSQGDWREIDRELRSEAMDILRRLDDLGDPGALP